MADRPPEFRGCFWEESKWGIYGFIAMPCVVYYPAKHAAFKVASNSFGVDSLVEDIAIGISMGCKPQDRGLADECAANGWSRRFARRKRAWHVVIKGHWEPHKDGTDRFCVDNRSETWGRP